MKKVLLLLLLAVTVQFAVAQEDTTEASLPPDFYIGPDVLGLANSFFAAGNESNLSLKYWKDVHKRVYRFSINYRLLKNRRYNMYSFVDADSNLITRNYFLDYQKVDFRFGSGMKNKLGFGEIMLGIDIIVGYAGITDNLLEYSVSQNDTLIYGSDSTSTQVFSLPSADYLNGGLDISLSYQIPLGDHFLLNVEYAPEVNFNYLVKERAGLHSSDYDYNVYYLDAAFNRFYLNVVYKF